jgi:hypothetical protein
MPQHAQPTSSAAVALRDTDTGRPTSSRARKVVTVLVRSTMRLGVDVPVALGAFLATTILFGTGAGRLGFYSDDAGFLVTLGGKGVTETLRSARDYVPGRNLHIIWQQLIFVLGGNSPGDLGALHAIQSCIDGIAVALFYLLLRRLRLPALWAVVGAATFAFYPNHGETHFWLSSAPMNLLSTLWFLCFAYVTVVAGERTTRTGEREPVWLLGLGVFFFGLALFTYDQTFFVLLFVLAVRAAQLVRRRVSLDAPLVMLGLGYVALILLYLALKRHPQSGPTLTHLDASHIWNNLLFSVASTVGWFFRYWFDFLLQTASDRDRVVGDYAAIVFATICGALIARELFAWLSRAPSRTSLAAGLTRSLALVAGGVACFFLAYLPTYVWFIAARHDFLPTAGLALAVAAAGAGLTAILDRRSHRAVSIAFASAVTVALAIFVAKFVAADLSEKRYWQESYQLRRDLYAKLLNRHLLAGKRAIVLEGFPQQLGPAPYFGQENELALDYLYPHKVALDASSLSALQTSRGYYLYTDITRYGPMAARFASRASVADIVYLSQTSSSIRFATSNRAYSVDRFYRVRTTALPTDARAPSPKLRSAVLRAHPHDATLTLDVATGGSSLAAGEQLAVVLFQQNGTPWTTPNALGQPLVVPIGLTEGRHPSPLIRCRVVLRGLTPGEVRRFVRVSLYLVSARPPTQLSTISVARS